MNDSQADEFLERVSDMIQDIARDARAGDSGPHADASARAIAVRTLHLLRSVAVSGFDIADRDAALLESVLRLPRVFVPEEISLGDYVELVALFEQVGSLVPVFNKKVIDAVRAALAPPEGGGSRLLRLLRPGETLRGSRTRALLQLEPTLEALHGEMLDVAETSKALARSRNMLRLMELYFRDMVDMTVPAFDLALLNVTEAILCSQCARKPPSLPESWPSRHRLIALLCTLRGCTMRGNAAAVIPCACGT